jgi:hypothetical protein
LHVVATALAVAPSEVIMAQQKDEVGPTGIYPPGVPVPDDAEVITPGDINEGHTGRGKNKKEGVQGAKRMPRKGDELDDLGDNPTD